MTPQAFVSPPHRRVSFSLVEIVELSMILGDHPSCRIGPPVQTSGEVQRRISVHLDDYEHSRSPRRKVDKLYLPSSTRRVILSSIEGIEAPPFLADCCRRQYVSSDVDLEETERRINQLNQRVDDLLDRMNQFYETMYHATLNRMRRRERRRSSLILQAP